MCTGRGWWRCIGNICFLVIWTCCSCPGGCYGWDHGALNRHNTKSQCAVGNGENVHDEEYISRFYHEARNRGLRVNTWCMIVVTLVDSFMPSHKLHISFVSLRKSYLILLVAAISFVSTYQFWYNARQVLNISLNAAILLVSTCQFWYHARKVLNMALNVIQ